MEEHAMREHALAILSNRIEKIESELNNLKSFKGWLADQDFTNAPTAVEHGLYDLLEQTVQRR